MFLSDNETAIDLLNNRVIAHTIVRLIRDDPHQPITVGVHGDWGAGKSSVLLMIEEHVRDDADVLCLRFNGWLFQGFEDAKVVLIEQIVQGMLDARPLDKKVAAAAKKVLKRIDWLRAAKKLGGLAFTAFTGVPSPDLLADLGSFIEKIKADPAGAAADIDLQSLSEQVASVSREPDAKHLPTEIHEFRLEFEELLKATGVGQLLVLIDDLDRCLPNATVETLEALRLFLWTPMTAFVIAADEAMIEYAVREHFPDLPASTGPLTYARNYLEKLVQVPFRISALGIAEARTFITLLLVRSELKEEEEAFAKLTEAARSRLARPWEGGGLPREVIEECLGDLMTQPVHAAVTLSEQVGRVLSRGTNGNPRQIKRFLNSYLLRFELARELGFSDDIERPVLAKLMLAERFVPEFFEYLEQEVSLSPSGRSEGLGWLESAVLNDSAGGEKIHDASTFLNNETIKSWIRIEPRLGEYDLRPYVFVTRDKRGLLGGQTTQDQLDEIAEALSGSDFMVQSRRDDVQGLKAEDASRLFRFLSERMIQSDRFDEKPPGAAGMALLANCHPALRPQLLHFLRNLPVERLGPWVATGWHDVFSGGLEAEFDRLMEAWAQQDENDFLKRAAQTARRAGSGGSNP